MYLISFQLSPKRRQKKIIEWMCVAFIGWKYSCHIILCAEQKWYFAHRCPLRHRIRYILQYILFILRCAVSTHHIMHTKTFVHIIINRRRRPSERCLICGRYGCIIFWCLLCMCASVGVLFFFHSSYFVCVFLCALVFRSVGPNGGHTTIDILYLNMVRSHKTRTHPAAHTQWGNIFFLRL